MTSLTFRLLIANFVFPTLFAASLDTQKVVNVVDEKATTSSSLAKTYGLPIQAVPYFNDATIHYNVPIGIGTNPSQLFNAVIDLQWADLWVVSQYCTACDHHLKYNATRSPTHESNGTAMHLGFPLWPTLYGNISTDTVTLGESLKIEHHPFVELAEWRGYQHEYDAALGLSPQPTLYGHLDESEPHLPSPFMGLIESNQLGKNSFALLLPHDRQDVGDLSFGTSHSEFHDGPLVSHPIYPANASTWQIEAPRISMRNLNGTELFNHSLSGLSAQIDSILPQAVAWVPTELAKTILQATNATIHHGDCYVPQVPCNEVSELPDLVFEFGGQEIVLRGEDYMVKAYWPLCFEGPYCTPLIGDISALQGRVGDEKIVLGAQFLKKVYSVFDWDNKTVSFAVAKHRFFGRTD